MLLVVFIKSSVFVIVSCPEAKVNSKIAIKDILSCNNRVKDLSNEADLYNNVLLNLDKRLSIDELNNYLSYLLLCYPREFCL